ncbi:hypothetical protein NPIL_571981 [Nephila pilipes]|uniref:Uncharacterized protein n=1 Tax=Nephila pilipes TaxID=299642 RepID=A0A8X6MXV0_NEPPI|nr:hypothetical protein NPIL_571981 [Nephila pilipes]
MHRFVGQIFESWIFLPVSSGLKDKTYETPLSDIPPGGIPLITFFPIIFLIRSERQWQGSNPGVYLFAAAAACFGPFAAAVAAAGKASVAADERSQSAGMAVAGGRAGETAFAADPCGVTAAPGVLRWFGLLSSDVAAVAGLSRQRYSLSERATRCCH